MKHTYSNIFNKTRSAFIIYIFSGFLFCSCKKLVDINAPKTETPSTDVFSTDGSANAALTGLYGTIVNGSAFLNTGYLTGLSADESDPAYSTILYAPFGTNTLTSADAMVGGQWSGYYTVVYQTNSILEGIQGSKGMSDSLKQQYTGEAKFIRALCHYYLVNLFGAVPLITATNVTINKAAGRTDSLTVYKQIISDLSDAVSLLPANYSNYGNRRDRPNKMAAAALLAKVYLAVGDNANAEKQASVVINSNLYSLLPSTAIDKVFLSGSKESIWAINPETATGKLSYTDANYYSFSSLYGALFGPQYVLQPGLANSFEPGDLRKSVWINSFDYQGTTYYYAAKYRDGDQNTKPTEYDIVLRLSDQYLVRAEARAKQNNINGAQDDLNVIRNRSGLGNTTAQTVTALTDAIINERQHELFLEFGNRWFDLKRTGRADDVLGKLKPATWKSTAVLYPIPLEEIKKAKQLSQNPGY
jgi:hypothetical protein